MISFLCAHVFNRSCIKAIDSVGVPPLPIPNREVKPNSADGTANVCGRVGHRHFFSRELQAIEVLFFLYMSLIPLINLGLFEHLTIPANRAPRGMNFVHTSRDYPLQELSNLLPGLFHEVALARCKTLKQVWCFTRLLATLWESRSSPLL